MEAFTLEDEAVSFNLTGQATGIWALQESPDFLNWSTLQTFDVTAGDLQHSEAHDRGAQRFFRLQSNP
ncbi:MAG: hypothetical protein EOP83_09350 [Verrucomicrobiaceae bacterium]|nr:MAG: hypothetical protein EOP83_09350 [Verrucomicrobiaceae bacterium]